MKKITVIGLDLAKNVFQLHGRNEEVTHNKVNGGHSTIAQVKHMT